MAAIEELEIIVSADITKALANLEELQEELQNVAEKIELVDDRGTEGITIRTHVDDLDTELAALEAEMRAFEETHEIDIDADIDNIDAENISRSFSEMFGRGGDGGGGTGAISAFGDVDFDATPAGRRVSVPDMDDGPSSLRRAIGAVGGELFDMRDTMENFDLRMSDIHNAMARLVPLLLLFIGVLPAAATALVGLAAAAVSAAVGLASLAGLGALGVGLEGGQFQMENLTEVLEQVRSDFIEAFAPLAERLEPLFEDAIDGLGRLFENIAQEARAFTSLTDEARAFGGFMMEFLPQLIRVMSAVAGALSPLFDEIASFLSTNLHGIMETVVELTAQAAPVIGQLLIKIGQMIPALVEMSIGFAKVANIVLSLIGLVGRFLEIFGLTPRLFGLVTAGALAAASAILIANSALIGLIIRGLAPLATVVYSTFVPAVATIVSGFTSTAVATYLATAALSAFLTLITLGAATALVGMATSAAAGFLGLADSIGKASNNLKEYNRLSGETSGGAPNPYASGVSNARLGGSRGSSPGNVTIIEGTGNPEQDRSNASYASWRQARTTGDNP